MKRENLSNYLDRDQEQTAEFQVFSYSMRTLFVMTFVSIMAYLMLTVVL